MLYTVYGSSMAVAVCGRAADGVSQVGGFEEQRHGDGEEV